MAVVLVTAILTTPGSSVWMAGGADVALQPATSVSDTTKAKRVSGITVVA